ncbi:MAG: hypothetical protein JO257_03680 [Deltaproteobacteria bacterium]|nr:hypothetical protein [Deltaproteobacteria bacterium]
MWRSLFLSSTSLLCFVACSDDGGSCGPKGAAAFGLGASNGSDVSLTYGNLSSGANNDCPDPAAPAGVISLTLSGQQSGGTGIITFCIPRPDLLATTPGRLGFDVKIIDLTGDANSCMLKIDSTAVPSGMVTSDGICKNGQDKAGYALAFNGHIVFTRTCAGTSDSVPAQLSGTVAVTAQ